MIKNRETSRKFFVDLLGFDTFFYGAPFTAKEEAVTPLGIPLNFTTKTKYRTAIYYPIAGELGRVEMIEFMNSIISTLPNSPCLLYTSPSPRDATLSRMPSSA